MFTCILEIWRFYSTNIWQLLCLISIFEYTAFEKIIDSYWQNIQNRIGEKKPIFTMENQFNFLFPPIHEVEVIYGMINKYALIEY